MVFRPEIGPEVALARRRNLERLVVEKTVDDEDGGVWCDANEITPIHWTPPMSCDSRLGITGARGYFASLICFASSSQD